MDKFGRSFRLTIDPNDGGDPIVIALPFTVQFTLQRQVQASLNYFVIDIFNLSEQTRNRIFQDRFVVRYRTVTFEAGYEVLTTCFSGYLFEANSRREGTDVITTLECRDGHFDVSTSMTFETLNKGATLGDVLKFLIGQFPNLELGAVGDFPDTFARPVTLNGNTYDLIKNYSSNKVFIDLGKVFVLKETEVLDGEIPLINASTGLIATPRRDESFLTVTTLFEPRISMSQLVALESEVLPVYNGQYKVLGVTHQGIISESVNGPLQSTLSLFTGTYRFGEFTKIASG